MSDSLGLYVHIPFCERKCAYCDFPSFAGQTPRQAPYVTKLCEEIREKGEELGRPPADTVFIGGGTPSMLAPELMKKVLLALRDSFDIAPSAEISCEANPGTLTPRFLQTLKEGGVNRLSLGAQSAHEDELKLLSRVHDWAQVVSSVKLAREYGFSNLNLDLMSGLPGQTWDKLRASVEMALQLKPTHLSCYSLIVEEGTSFAALFEQGRLNLPGEEEERALYHNTGAFLTRTGYHHYEISNYALPGHECRHNRNCWLYHDYLGFGLSAAGLYKGRRFKNPSTLDGYLNGEPPEITELSPEDKAFEQTMLGLRLREGVRETAFLEKQGKTLLETYPEALARHEKDGLLVHEQGFWRLTDKGLDLMDQVLIDLLP